jgi:hypothetical protein
MEGCHQLGTRDLYVVHYSNPFITGGQKHTHTHLFVKNNTAAQHKDCKSLSPDQKAQVLTINAAEHKKHRQTLSPEQKVQVMTIDAAAYKKQYELLPPEKKLDSRKPGLNNIMNI